MKALETVHKDGAQRYCKQITNISYFYHLLESMGNRRWLSTCRFVSCPCQHAPLYRPMLILAYLTGVSGLVV